MALLKKLYNFDGEVAVDFEGEMHWNYPKKDIKNEITN